MSGLTLTHDDQRALWEACESQWERVRKQFWRVYLPTQEWEDIRSEAFARVMRKAHLYRPQKGALDNWLNTVMRRALTNELRRLLPSRSCHEARTQLLLCARPIQVRVVRDCWGAERVVANLDIAVPESGEWLSEADLNAFRRALHPKERRVLNVVLKGGRIGRMVRRLRLRDYSEIHKSVRILRLRWRAFEQGTLKQQPVEARAPRGKRAKRAYTDLSQ